MEGTIADKRLLKAIYLSFAIHLLVGICVTLNFKVSNFTGANMKPLEVSLVEAPILDKGESVSAKGTVVNGPVKNIPEHNKAQVTKVTEPKETQRPKEVPLAKREVNLPKPKEEGQKETQRLLEEALSTIREKVKKEEEEKAHLKQALQKLSDNVGTLGSGTPKEGYQVGARAVGGLGRMSGGLAMDIYKAQITNVIWSNWNFPANMYEESKLLKLEAIVRLVVERSGNVLEYRVIKRSNDPTFDSSILRAIEKSNPLPPFPDSYEHQRQEIDVIFNVRDLINKG